MANSTTGSGDGRKSDRFSFVQRRDLEERINKILEEDEKKKPDDLPAEMGEFEITPEMARDWLLRNDKNRKINYTLLTKLMLEIEGNRWVLNGQTISFKDNGELNDGQHRLWAVVLTGKPIQSLVVFDVVNKAFATVDTGKSRSGADVLHIAGTKYAGVVASAARWAIAMEEGTVTYRTMSAGTGRVANAVLLGFVRRHATLREAVENYVGKQDKPLDNLLQPSIVCYALWVTTERAPRKAAEFWQRLATGVGLHEGNPILTLREQLMEERLETRRNLKASAVLSFVIKAWNAWEAGKQLRLLKFMNNERFPQWGDNPDTSYVLPTLERALAGERVKRPPKRLDDRLVWKQQKRSNGYPSWIVDIPASLEKNGLTLREIRDRSTKYATGTVANLLRRADARQNAGKSA